MAKPSGYDVLADSANVREYWQYYLVGVAIICLLFSEKIAQMKVIASGKEKNSISRVVIRNSLFRLHYQRPTTISYQDRCILLCLITNLIPNSNFLTSIIQNSNRLPCSTGYSMHLLGACYFDPVNTQANKQFVFLCLFSTRKRISLKG